MEYENRKIVKKTKLFFVIVWEFYQNSVRNILKITYFSQSSKFIDVLFTYMVFINDTLLINKLNQNCNTHKKIKTYPVLRTKLFSKLYLLLFQQNCNALKKKNNLKITTEKGIIHYYCKIHYTTWKSFKLKIYIAISKKCNIMKKKKNQHLGRQSTIKTHYILYFYTI